VRLTQTKFTVSAAAVIFNEKSEVLLLDHVLRPRSGWGLPGGFLDAEEQPADALKREILEETGLSLVGLRLYSIRTAGRHIEIVYVASAEGDARPRSREIYGLGWFGADNLPDGLPSSQAAMICSVLNSEI
jgi:ADP-ribose pyrophosphatase YjhB (NUDIX family)